MTELYTKLKNDLTSNRQYLNNAGTALSAALSKSTAFNNPAITAVIKEVQSQQQQALDLVDQNIARLTAGNVKADGYIRDIQALYELDPSLSKSNRLADYLEATGSPGYADLISDLRSVTTAAQSFDFSKIRNYSTDLLAATKATSTPANSATNQSANNAANSGQAKPNSNTTNANAEAWGVKFKLSSNSINLGVGGSVSASGVNTPNPTKSDSYYFALLPAMSSILPMQGSRDTPNATPGLSFKIMPNIAKMKVPGFQPIFQHLGVDGLIITIVGTFTGADGFTSVNRPLFESYGVRGLDTEAGLRKIIGQLDAYKNFQEFYQFAVQEGRALEVEINLAKNGLLKQEAVTENKVLRAGNGNPKFTGLIKSMEVYHSRPDRTWYTIQFEVTDFKLASKNPINLTNQLNQRIQAAQQEKVQAEQAKQQAIDKALSAEVQETLKNGRYEKFALNDGSTLYKIQSCKGSQVVRGSSARIGTDCTEQWIQQVGDNYKNVTQEPNLQALKDKATGSLGGGDLLSIAGSTIGCGLAAGGALVITGGTVGLGTPLAVGLAGVGCGYGAYSIYNTVKDGLNGKGKDLVQGGIDFGINLIPGAGILARTGLGQGALKLGGNLVTKIGAGGIVNTIGNVGGRITGLIPAPITNFLNKDLSNIKINLPNNIPLLNQAKASISNLQASILPKVAAPIANPISEVGKITSNFYNLPSGTLINSVESTASGRLIKATLPNGTQQALPITNKDYSALMSKVEAVPGPTVATPTSVHSALSQAGLPANTLATSKAGTMTGGADKTIGNFIHESGSVGQALPSNVQITLNNASVIQAQAVGDVVEVSGATTWKVIRPDGTSLNVPTTDIKTINLPNGQSWRAK